MKAKVKPLFSMGEVVPEFYIEEPMLSATNKEAVRIAKLESGKLVEYDYCVSEEEIFRKPNTEFVGRGQIVSVDGVLQYISDDEVLCFWRDKFRSVGGCKTETNPREILSNRAKEFAEKQIIEALQKTR